MALLLVSGSATWIDRDRIIGNLIDNYLIENGVTARYEIVEISPQQQVIANLAIGDPAAPDFSAEQVVIDIGFGLMGPSINKVEITQARLFGTFMDGKFSLGALDPLIFTDSEEPATLPGINVVFRDARALIETDYGAIAAKLDGAGRLDDGFEGTLAVTAPGIGPADCRADRATAFGDLTTTKGKPEFAGPIRLAAVRCAGAAIAAADLGAKLGLSATLDSADGRLDIAASGLEAGGAAAGRVGGQAAFAVSATGAALEHDLTLGQIGLPYAAIAAAEVKGTLRTADLSTNAPSRKEWSGDFAASGIRLADPALRELSESRKNLAGTLFEPLLDKIAENLPRALNGASFASEAIIRSTEQNTRLIIPEARLRSGSGEIILALSQVNWGLNNAETPSGQGNFITAGQGLPRINGRVSAEKTGGFSLRLAMADYTAGNSRLAIPRLSFEQTGPDAYRFSGLAAASGAIPGGQISGLQLPLEGRWSRSVGLLAGTRCTDIRFEALQVAELDLAGRKISVCPDDRRAMLRYDDRLSLGVRTSQLALAGTLGGSPAKIEAANALLRYPGPFVVEGLSASLGDAGTNQSRIALASLTGQFGDNPRGQFAGGEARLGDIAFALSDIAGDWRFDDGAFQIADAAFILTDRAPGQPRFEPVKGKGASLKLNGDDITARARLHNPPSDQQLAQVSLRHNLATTAGRADIVVDDLTFGPALDAENLTYLAKGVVAFAKGAISGRGRVEWAGDDITSDGTFRSDGIDFAAAFGPVRGLRGELRFTDLLALTTAPDQQLEIASINTGVEVLDGRVTFALRDGQIITISDARWPFMDGELVLRPVTLDFSRPSEKRYEFEITGLDAATFVAEMELTNLAVTGKFDGTVPIIFDSSGNGRVENGLLRARPPGGNVAYIGDLTYEDMGAISNYAFRALRSLDYRDMSVVLDGSLTGEIVSQFEFEGVRQGEGASRNFITRRLARLPILFRINVKAESFYELATVVRSFFDVTMLGNPLDRGLLKLENGRFVPAQPASVIPQDNSVQPSESENRP